MDFRLWIEDYRLYNGKSVCVCVGGGRLGWSVLKRTSIMPYHSSLHGFSLKNSGLQWFSGATSHW